MSTYLCTAGDHLGTSEIGYTRIFSPRSWPRSSNDSPLPVIQRYCPNLKHNNSVNYFRCYYIHIWVWQSVSGQQSKLDQQCLHPISTSQWVLTKSSLALLLNCRACMSRADESYNGDPQWMIYIVLLSVQIVYQPPVVSSVPTSLVWLSFDAGGVMSFRG